MSAFVARYRAPLTTAQTHTEYAVEVSTPDGRRWLDTKPSTDRDATAHALGWWRPEGQTARLLQRVVTVSEWEEAT